MSKEKKILQIYLRILAHLYQPRQDLTFCKIVNLGEGEALHLGKGSFSNRKQDDVLKLTTVCLPILGNVSSAADVQRFWEEIFLMQQITPHKNIISLYFGGNYVGKLLSYSLSCGDWLVPGALCISCW